MRKGFTMIELIFVIVILGILAAVAVPKLTATRDDAEVAKALANIKLVINDVQAYYTAHGEYPKPITRATNVTLFDWNSISNSATPSTQANRPAGDGGAGAMIVKKGGCVYFDPVTINENNQKQTGTNLVPNALEIKTATDSKRSADDKVCAKVQQQLGYTEKIVRLGGSGIVY